jgi:hypothetical protein
MPSSAPAPFFPTPPEEYSRQYMSQVVRAFSVFVQQVNNLRCEEVWEVCVGA